MIKKVKRLFPSIKVDMDGFPVKQPLPTRNVEQIDPFLLLHHASAKYSNNRPAKHQGVGPHPHRGFSPVTFVIEGEVHHRDSRGNNQIAKKGEVQWMYAGAGIIHSERPSKELVEGTRRQEIVQLWINSPSDKKMIPPAYHYVSNDEVSTFQSEDLKVSTKLIVGSYNDIIGKIPTQSNLMILWSEGSIHGKTSFEIPANFNAMIYLIKGQISVAGYGVVDSEHLIEFAPEGDLIELTISKDNTEFLVLCGEPLNEKLAQHGPYVMNDQTQILEAMRDYQMGKRAS